ncbi:MAG: DUF1015 domain-containing protein [Nitrospirota bacterium]|nr:DUF1015 domain-containing protein [Nitrospirota bacterium]
MAEVVPFKGVLYNVSKISQKSGEDLLAPPYDIITPEYREELYDKNPCNIVRIDFGKEFQGDNERENKYTLARAFLRKWIDEEILVKSDRPVFYAYEVAYTINGAEKKLRGFFGLVRLEELGKGTIYPHECTHAKPKQDRLDLMRICDANISPIFSLYNSPEKKTSGMLADISTTTPYLEARDSDGSVHRLWEIKDAEQIALITEELKDKTIFIADGHHRYETALEYQGEMRKKHGMSGGPEPFDYVMMFLSNMSDEGLTVLPTHRLVKNIPEDTLERLSAYFEIEKVFDNFNVMYIIDSRSNVLGFYNGDADGWYILKHRGEDLSDVHPVLRALDVTILHDLVFKKLLNVDDIVYEMDTDKTLRLVREKQFDAAFFLNPTQVGDVETVALASLRMPPKSTYFYPKLLTGLVLNLFNKTF